MPKVTLIEVLVAICIVCILGAILAPAIDMATASKTDIGYGKILDKSYTPAYSFADFSIQTDSDGNVIPVWDTTHVPEKFILVVKHSEGTVSIETDPTTWGSVSKEEMCHISTRVGKFGRYSYTVSKAYDVTLEGE